MINIQDLRIGNYIIVCQYSRESIEQVDSIAYGFRDSPLINIHSEGSAYGDSSIEGVDLSNCKPIPITQELLIRAGIDNEHWYGDRKIFKLKPYIKMTPSDNGWEIYTDKEYNDISDNIDIA